MFSKTQIDRLGDRLRLASISDADLKLLDTYRRSLAPAYEQVIETIRRTVAYPVTGRPAKSTSSIVEKLHRESIRLTQMQDIAGCRLIVPQVAAQNRVVKILGKCLDMLVVDRRKHPSHGYRAVHLIAKVDNKAIEIQLRTRLEHLWAEFSEKLSDVVDPAIKYGGGPSKVREILDKSSQIVGGTEELELERITPSQRKQMRNIRQQLRRFMKSSILELSDVMKGK